MKVREVMTEAPAFCTPEIGLQAAAKMMCDSDCGALPVLESRQTMIPVGVITDRDLACRIIARGRDPFVLQVSDCMSSPAVTVGLETDIDSCCDVLRLRQLRRLPVVDDDGRCCGIVAQADIARKCGAAMAGEVVREVSLAGF